MRIWTDAIDDRGHIDSRYTCDIDNSSPELRWGEPPPGTGGYAIVAEDLDLGNAENPFIHWVIYNIPMELLHLPAGIPPQDSLPNGIRQGVNSLGKLGYAGPCPPRGSQAHHYVFRIYALKELPEPETRTSGKALMEKIKPLVLEVAEIKGQYQRQYERTG